MYRRHAPVRNFDSRRRTQYFPLIGAIDLVTQEMKKNPGSAREALNYEPGLEDGFRRIDGFERFDGRAAPSAATWYVIELSDASDREVGDVLTGADSGATSVIVLIDGNSVAVTALSGSYDVGEATDGAGEIVIAELELSTLSSYLDNEIELAAQAHYRSLITAVPGSGSVLGVWRHLGTTYAFRNNADGTAAIPHKATTSGWAAIELYHVLRFSTGSSAFAFGEAITSSSGGTGTVKKVVKLSGEWADGDAAGYLVIDISSGTFLNTNTLSGGGAATATANAAEITFLPGGRFEFISHNFFASNDTYAVYGCDGVNPAFEIDSNDVITPIYTASTPDTPKYLIAHKFHLFLAINSSLIQSKVGEPFNYDGTLGAAEHAVGAPVTGLKEQPGDVLTVATRRQTWGMYGSTADDFDLKLVSKDSGALDYSYQSLGYPFGFDDRGVTAQQRVNAFGNFEAATISRLIQPLIDQKKLLLTASSVLRKRNQLRLYFSDGSAIVIAVSQSETGFLARATTLELGKVVTCICNCEDEFGNERVYFGSDDGFVYEAEKGFSLDGEALEHFLRLNYNNPYGDIRREFEVFGVIFNVKSESNFTLRVTQDLSYSSPDQAPVEELDVEVTGGGGYFDVDNWDEFYYDVQVISTAAVPLAGVGTSISLAVYGNDAITKSFEIEGYTLDFSPRGMVRGY